MFSVFLKGLKHEVGAGLPITFGTSSFYSVWEEACREVFEKNLDDPIEGFSLTSGKLKSYIKSPVWYGADDRGEFYRIGSSTLLPDIVFGERGVVLSLFILDAKYYNFRFVRGKNPDRAPDIPDISKQFLYSLALRGAYNDFPISSTKNCFLFPSQDSGVRNLGEVSWNIFDQMGLERIQLRSISVETVFSAVLQGKRLDSSLLEL
ncbi:LlaJI family restriction endonuclease [Corynebacterium parakroppenstedtii]|uniref:LlaJI family restriction endonuclease n=1 Tax=Corynebacterium parakroppenstedtii TaxID=2828363 RepID=UPI001C8F3BEA|nr:LlaJI family restriction endonuclease [Corynebacterium parakroppenstedtii]MBY0795276.1 LlaJI family restriction endonuclease [Corynebacterium parakroppenstedtii]